MGKKVNKVGQNKDFGKRWQSFVDSYRWNTDNESNDVYRVLLAKTPNILRFARAERQKAREEIIDTLYSLDWIQIMSKAIESRPSSWRPLGFESREYEIEGKKWKTEKYSPQEWRNASDTIMSAVVNALRNELKSPKSDKGAEKGRSEKNAKD